MYEVTVVVPALNEQIKILGTIEEIVAAFQMLGLDGEIIIVNDGSTDRTGEFADIVALYRENVLVLHHDKPQGIGASFREGASVAMGEYVVMLPGDGENYPFEILKYVRSNSPIVIPYVEKDIRKLHRRFLSKLYKGIVNKTFGTNFTYTNGTVLYQKKILDDLSLHANGFFYQTEILVKSIRAGWKYIEVPYHIRPTRKSNALKLTALKRVAKDYLNLVKEVCICSGF